MSRVTLLQAAGGASSVKFLEITRIRSKDPNILACIFEGQDEKYYGCRLSTILGHGKWAGINTGGRKIVLEVRDLILAHAIYKNTKFACFIDRDYGDWFQNPDPQRIYITPCYSVENLYTSETCFSQILAAEFDITPYSSKSKDYQAALQIFKDRTSEFLDHALKFNCWAKSRAIMERENKQPIKLYLSDISAESIADITLSSCTIKYDPNDISSLFKKLKNSDLCSQSTQEAFAGLKKCDRLLHFRGKQQLEFFGILISLLKIEISKSNSKIFSNKKSVKLSLEKTDLISELSQYAITPECLTEFIKSFA